MNENGLTNLKVKEVAIKDLRPHPQNPNKHPKSQIVKLQRSLKQFGYASPIIVTTDNMVIAGHGRLEAIKGMEDVAPEMKIQVLESSLDGVEAKAYMLADNRIGEDSEVDRERLFEIFNDLEIEGVDVLSTGFTNIEISALGYEINLINSADELDGLKGDFTPKPRELPDSSNGNAGNEAVSDISNDTDTGDYTPEMVVMSFTIPAPERDKAIEVLEGIKEEHNLTSISEAFIRLISED